MIIAFIFCAILLALCAFILALKNDLNGAARLILATCLAIIGAGWFYDQKKPEPVNRPPYVDLPEEHKAISNNWTCPDKFSGFISNDTLHLNFDIINEKSSK